GQLTRIIGIYLIFPLNLKFRAAFSGPQYLPIQGV
ncbi:MAG: hypothetical protein ACI8S3_002543, partial [Alphaproteobacteria bacterium]